MRRLWIVLGAIFVAALALFRLLFRKGEYLDWQAVPKPGSLIEVDGAQIHYVDEGAGPPVVLIHGFGGHTYSYRDIQPRLARDYRAVALDLLGFGYSERAQAADYSHEGQAKRVVRFMDALGIEKASLVGHSMGGEVAMRVAARWPERVERLALVASVSGDRVPTLPVTPLARPFLPAFSRMLGKRMLRASLFDKSRLTEEMWEAYRRPSLIRGSMDGLYQILKQTRKDPPVQYGRISAPVLLMFADHERIIPGWMSRRLRGRFPESDVAVIADAGHLLLQERPAQCYAALRQFLGATAMAEQPQPEASVTSGRE